MILAVILIKTEADHWGVCGGHTPIFCQISIGRIGRIGQTPLTHPPIHFLFILETFRNMKHKNSTKKHKISRKKIRVGAWSTHPLPSFSRIFGFFLTWQNP